MYQVDIDLKEKIAKKRGTKKELQSYLADEIGTEVEFSMMTSCFFLQGQVKSDELGKAFRILTNAKFLWNVYSYNIKNIKQNF